MWSVSARTSRASITCAATADFSVRRRRTASLAIMSRRSSGSPEWERASASTSAELSWISNRTVKRVCADDSVPFAHAKVGYRQAIFNQGTPASTEDRGFLLAPSRDDQTLGQRCQFCPSCHQQRVLW